MITADELHRVLHYDPETGYFIWLVRPGKRVGAGQLAGCIDAHGYRSIRFGNVRHYGHRLAWLYMTGQHPPKYIDHANGNPADNRWANLRAATQAQNNANAKLRRNNTSGLKGACWDPRNGRWKAQIIVSGRTTHLGRFKSKEEAHSAYLAAARELYGEFARAG